jgi:hypothetical protein
MFDNELDPFDRLMLAETRIQELAAITEEQCNIIRHHQRQLTHTASALNNLHKMNLMMDHRMKLLEERANAHT